MSKIEEQAEQLYERALSAALRSEEGKARTFSSEELLELDVVQRKDALMPICQQLSDGRLMRFLQLEGKVHFALRTAEIAKRLLKLGKDEVMIYEHIEGAGTNGMWTKMIKQRTSIAPQVITRLTKKMEASGLLKQLKTVKNPNHRCYIVAYLDPGEGVVGGPWHTEGELDMELIGVTSDAIMRFIERETWDVQVRRIKRERSMSPLAPLAAPDEQAQAAGKKRKIDSVDGDIEGVHTKSKRSHGGRIEVRTSKPPGWRHYPTAAAVFHFIQQSGFIKAAVAISEEDIENLLQVLVFDDRLERIGNGYRTIRGVSGASDAMKNMVLGKSGGEFDDVEGNGITQVPCGRCPVFDLCEDGGPVNARNCVYFDTWLKA